MEKTSILQRLLARQEGWQPDPEVAAFWEKFDLAYLAQFADRLVNIGQYELGYRLPGTESGRQAANLIAGEMRQVGLAEVSLEPFPVHAWDFKGAGLVLNTLPPQRFTASSYAAVPGTPPEGLTALLVDVGAGTAADYLGKDVRGRLAFVHMDFDKFPWIGTMAHEAELHGAAGVVLYHTNRIAQHESGQALNTEDANIRQTIPVIYLARRDGEAVAAQLAQGPLEATLHCQVTNRPQATGYNVLGMIPGSLYPDRYLLLQAHYDSWFYGYWDNTIGVSGILTIAKALLDSGYRPRHTLLIVSPDAEEFGAPDTAYGWLYGCQHMLESHPEWPGKMTCAFNIDTLAHRWQQGIQFIGCAEMLDFMRGVLADYRVAHFPEPTASVAEQITPWTEVYNYVYFGIPTIQPRFKIEGDVVRNTIYHTQLDNASVVDLPGAAEILCLYGALLIHLDRLPVVPYTFSERAHSIRQSLDPQAARLAGSNLAELECSLASFESWAAKIETGIQEVNNPASSISAEKATRFNDKLRQVARRLLPASYYVEGDFPNLGQYEHLLWQKDLLALEKAQAHLTGGDVSSAIAALTDPQTGVGGGWYALNTSYPVYHRHIRDSLNPARTDLLWGRERTIPLTDIWMELYHLQDKCQRGLTDFAPEIYTLRQKQEAAAAGYRAALECLAHLLHSVAETDI
jgi:Iap family predicted aminopeptidase